MATSQNDTLDLTVKCSLANELAECERGSWEDFKNDPLTTPRQLADHPYEVCHLYRSQIRMRNVEQLQGVWYACCTGTFQLRHLRAAQSLWQRLRPLVEEHARGDLKLWAYPDGF
jgi:hypothetical protein